jgi:hypothetical protein
MELITSLKLGTFPAEYVHGFIWFSSQTASVFANIINPWLALMTTERSSGWVTLATLDSCELSLDEHCKTLTGNWVIVV